MSAISSQIQAVLELFEGPLSELRFADIDAAALRRLAADVETAAGEVDAQQLALTRLRAALDEKQEQLLTQAQRALAYARVYAENDDALSARLAAIHFPRGPKRAKAEPAAEHGAAAAVSRAADEAASSPKRGRKREGAAPSSAADEARGVAENESVPVEVTASDEAAEEPEAARLVPQRRGKRRDAGRVVTLDDAVESGA
jgi:hypothetical protein